ncbi:MAG TPA: TetR/AcrR family transcriptional regulator [Candidatus Limnocylindrales bacterium]|nr:TetR/AcrR family transcriptional regulator [Candidatus Limnocylindrales bacterium]
MAIETSRRQQIEDAASTLFRERGYAATSVRDIAHALNIQGGSLYAHVASKEDVLWSIVSRAADRFNAEVAPLAADHSTTLATTRLRQMVRAHVEVVTSSQRDAAVFLHEWRFLSPDRRTQMAERRDAYEALFRQAIGEGISAGTFSAVDPRVTATAILTALNGIATWYRPDGPLSAQEIADQYADLFLRALTCDAPASPRKD